MITKNTKATQRTQRRDVDKVFYKYMALSKSYLCVLCAALVTSVIKIMSFFSEKFRMIHVQ